MGEPEHSSFLEHRAEKRELVFRRNDAATRICGSSLDPSLARAAARHRAEKAEPVSAVGHGMEAFRPWMPA